MNKKITLKINNFLEFYMIPFLRSILNKRKAGLLTNIGAENQKQKGRALFIGLDVAIPYYITGDLDNCAALKYHALVWETYDFVRQLIERNYVVDFYSSYDRSLNIEWHKYDLIIDEANNLINCPGSARAIKVYYSTGLPFDHQNKQELDRVNAFYARTGIAIEPKRFALPNLSARVADHILYYGTEALISKFDPKPARHQLNISVTHEIDITLSEGAKDLMWFGSVGPLHKGLDLVVEAFKTLPYKLHIFGKLDEKDAFFEWLNQQMRVYPNIYYHGVGNIDSKDFQLIASNCIANIFPSCSEGGPGSVAQTSFWGLIPIVTTSANVRSQKFGYVIDTDDTAEIIDQIRSNVLKVIALTPKELKHKRELLKEFCRQNHTRKAYSESVTKFLDKINA